MSKRKDELEGKVEVWKPIKGFVNKYEISNWGSVKSMKRYVTHKNDTVVLINERILKKSTDAIGYHHVRISSGHGNYTLFKVHTLVAIHFLGHEPCGHKVVVHHKDANKQNNHISNLVLTSQRSNCSTKPGSSGATGVMRNANGKRWLCKVWWKGKLMTVGTYDTIEEASKQRLIKLRKLENEL